MGEPVTGTQERLSLMWLCRSFRLFKPICPNVRREIGQYLGSLYRYIPQITGNSLSIYDSKTSTTTKSSLSLTFSYSSVFVLIHTSRILCLNPVGPQTDIYILDTPSPILQLQGSLAALRSYPGLINVAGDVYVFGGQKLKTAERLRVAYKEWKSLPDMQHVRSGFMPCCAGRDIHLPSATSSQVLWEVWDVSKQEYRSIEKPLIPGIYDNSVSFLAGWDLIVVSAQKKIGKFSLKSGICTHLSCIVLARCEDAMSNLAPVQIDRSIYWVTLSGGLMTYSLDSGLVVYVA